LDAAAPDHPVLITHRGGHTSYANSRALAIADINEKTPDPQGGKIEHDANGKLTGRLLERASAPLRRKIPSTATREDRREGVKLISLMFAKAGVTSVHDAQGTPEDLQAYQDSWAAGELRSRVYCLINYAHIDKMIAAGVR